jgi:hypothetical protein
LKLKNSALTHENTFDQPRTQARAPENHKTSRWRRFYTDKIDAAIQNQTGQDCFVCNQAIQEKKDK